MKNKLAEHSERMSTFADKEDTKLLREQVESNYREIMSEIAKCTGK